MFLSTGIVSTAGPSMDDSPVGSDSEACLPDPQVPWTPEQWERVRQVAAAEADRSRVAAGFLPLYGPLPNEADFVRTNLISSGAIADEGLGRRPEDALERLEIDDTSTIKLWVLQVKLFLRGAQMADPELTSVLGMFRRAANVLSRLEDTLVFNGLPKGKTNSERMKALPPIWEVLGRREGDPSRWMPGLLPETPGPYPELLGRYDPDPSKDQDARRFRQWVSFEEPKETERDLPLAPLGNRLVSEISEAIGNLEANGHYGPFALVLGQKLFQALQTPNSASLVLPQDRVIPFLGSGGSLLRSTTIPPEKGVIVALGGDPVELVIAKDIAVHFLQVTTDPYYVFRLHEKLVLRIKHPGAIRGLWASTNNPPAPKPTARK
jgi:uncharacterized linocin/CFP29 family protein